MPETPICPQCKQPLTRFRRSWICPNWTLGLPALPIEHIPAYANATINGLNPKRRPILGGRLAVEWWLERNGIFRVIQTPECQPISA